LTQLVGKVGSTYRSYNTGNFGDNLARQ